MLELKRVILKFGYFLLDFHQKRSTTFYPTRATPRHKNIPNMHQQRLGRPITRNVCLCLPTSATHVVALVGYVLYVRRPVSLFHPMRCVGQVVNLQLVHGALHGNRFDVPTAGCLPGLGSQNAHK